MDREAKRKQAIADYKAKKGKGGGNATAVDGPSAPDSDKASAAEVNADLMVQEFNMGPAKKSKQNTHI